LRANQLVLGDGTRDLDLEPEPPKVVRKAVELQDIDDVPPEALAAAVPLEAIQTPTYTASGSPESDAIKTEAALIDRFRRSLIARGHEVGRFKIGPVDGATYLYTDIYDVSENCLYEAKGCADRDSVRMAIGQLIDYSRHILPAPGRAVLLPQHPTSDLTELLTACGITCIYEDFDVFKMAES
jgi:hypothetical protein